LNASIGKVCVALALSAMATVLLTACGGGGGSDSGSSSSTSAAQEGQPAALSPTAPITKQLAVTFPKPKVEPGAPAGTAKAIAAGRRACAGKTPVEVRDEFISAAESGAGLNEGQKEMVEEIAKFEKQASHSPNFAAGQLAAGVYEATLPEKERIGGYQGCVYELAVQLRKELAKSKK
jgi:hypothetical protein